MNFERDQHTRRWTLNITSHTFIDPIFEWDQLRPGFNWRTFHLIHVMYEQDAMLASHEFELVVLGIGFRMRTNGDWESTETGRDLLKRMEEIGNGTAKAVPIEELDSE